MADITRILITSPGGIPGDAVAKSLRSHGLDVRFLDSPKANKDKPGFLRALDREIKEFGADMILPVFFPETIAAVREKYPDICIPLDSEQKLTLLDNKLSCLELASRLGIPQPRRICPGEPIERFPVVFKRPLGQGGDSVYFPGSSEALGKLLRTAPEAIITEYIEGYNVSVDALRWGPFFFAASYRVLEPIGKGISTLRESICAPELETYARRMLAEIDFRGVCGFDFRVDVSTGEAFFLECNPRFSGGIASAIESGFDIPYIYYRLAIGEIINPEEIHFTPGIITK